LEGEGDDGIALRFLCDLGIASGGDHQELLAMRSELVRHGHDMAAGGKLPLPEFPSSFNVKSSNERHLPKNQAAWNPFCGVSSRLLVCSRFIRLRPRWFTAPFTVGACARPRPFARAQHEAAGYAAPSGAAAEHYGPQAAGYVVPFGAAAEHYGAQAAGYVVPSRVAAEHYGAQAADYGSSPRDGRYCHSDEPR
jgi:hypothetical protein